MGYNVIAAGPLPNKQGRICHPNMQVIRWLRKTKRKYLEDGVMGWKEIAKRKKIRYFYNDINDFKKEF